MALRLSTALRNLLAGKKPYVVDGDDTQIAFVNATNKITDTQLRFITNMFRADDYILVSGADIAANNRVFKVTSVATTGADIVVDPAPTEDPVPSGPATITLCMPPGLADALRHGVLGIYSSSQPASADTAPPGTLLVLITVSSAAFVKGTATNGLDFDAPALGVINKAAGETWSGVAGATGTAGWFRFYDNSYNVAGDGVNIDGSVGTSGANLNLSSTSIVAGATIVIGPNFKLTIPAAA